MLFKTLIRPVLTYRHGRRGLSPNKDEEDFVDIRGIFGAVRENDVLEKEISPGELGYLYREPEVLRTLRQARLGRLSYL